MSVKLPPAPSVDEMFNILGRCRVFAKQNKTIKIILNKAFLDDENIASLCTVAQCSELIGNS
ncbi:hypothetical protein ASF04_26200 [Duganella sp. Leaf61]|nr:hypothetical protein ASF04_26200 [Duganella sp. Leaf61]